MTLSMVINYLLKLFIYFIFLYFIVTNHDTACALGVLADYLVW